MTAERDLVAVRGVVAVGRDRQAPCRSPHVELGGLRGACLLEAGDDAYPLAPSLWLVGRCGSPSVILILDATADDDRERQAAAVRRLRARWGERVGFDDSTTDTEERVLH